MYSMVPKVGLLYKFRTDNINYLLKKYNYYYEGLLLCTTSDILSETDAKRPFDYEEYRKLNPIYTFEVYNCIQHYFQLDFFEDGIKVDGPLFLNFNEVCDMLQIASNKDSA